VNDHLKSDPKQSHDRPIHKTLHMCISVRGAITNFKPREWRNCVEDSETGRTLKPDEVFQGFLDELARGHEVIPFGKPCEGFDYSGGGCPGHPAEADHESIGS